MPFRLKPSLPLIASAAAFAVAVPAFGQTSPAATPAPAPAAAPAPTTTIGQALAQSTDHATLQKLVQAAQLEAVLSGPGPITVFAPNNAAFSRLAPGTLDTLLKPDNAKSLSDILKYHIVRGSIGALDLKKMIEAAGGSTALTTLQGQTVTASEEPSGALLLTDANGNKSYISAASAVESNGVVEYVNGVLTPKLTPGGEAAPAAELTMPADDQATDQSTPPGA